MIVLEIAAAAAVAAFFLTVAIGQARRIPLPAHRPYHREHGRDNHQQNPDV